MPKRTDTVMTRMPDFELCVACGTICHAWERSDGFCFACQRDETLGDQNVPLSHVARRLDLRNRKESFQAMQLIRCIKAIGIHRTTDIIAKLGELF